MLSLILPNGGVITSVHKLLWGSVLIPSQRQINRGGSSHVLLIIPTKARPRLHATCLANRQNFIIMLEHGPAVGFLMLGWLKNEAKASGLRSWAREQLAASSD